MVQAISPASPPGVKKHAEAALVAEAVVRAASRRGPVIKMLFRALSVLLAGPRIFLSTPIPTQVSLFMDHTAAAAVRDGWYLAVPALPPRRSQVLSIWPVTTSVAGAAAPIQSRCCSIRDIRTTVLPLYFFHLSAISPRGTQDTRPDPVGT